MSGNILDDDARIRVGISRARAGDREIDHGTARIIAAQWHGGQTSALCALATTGAVVDGARSEVLTEYAAAPDQDAREALGFLGSYLRDRTSRGEVAPVPGWAGLWGPADLPLRDLP